MTSAIPVVFESRRAPEAGLAIVCRACERVYHVAPEQIQAAGVRCTNCGSPRQIQTRLLVAPATL